MESVTLVIRLNENGRVSVVGPLHEKLVLYGMLEIARQTIQEHVVEEKTIVQPASYFGPVGRG